MSKRTEITELFDEEGRIIERITVIVEDEEDYPEPAYVPSVPTSPSPVFPFYQPNRIWSGEVS